MHTLHPVTIATLHVVSLSKHWGVWGQRPMSTDYRDLLHVECLLIDIYTGQYIQFYEFGETKLMKGPLNVSLSLLPDRNCSQPATRELG